MRINTVTGKIMLLTLVVGMVMLALISLFFPSIFYYAMKSSLIQQVSSVVSGSALRQSYIWANNSYVYEIVTSEEMAELVRAYYAGNEEAEEQIVSLLPVLYNGLTREDDQGEDDYGYIVSTNFLMMFTSEGDAFFREEAREAYETLQESEWMQTLDLQMDIKDHLPLIEDGDSSYFGVVESFRVDEINCFVVNMVTKEDILRQMEELEEFGLEDYMIFCGSQILYTHLGDASGIHLEAYPERMFEGNQYEVMVWENGSETDFTVLCTYKQEDYQIAVHVTKSILLQPYGTAFLYFRLLMAAITAMLVALFGITLKANLRRLTVLEREMDRVRGGDYEVTVPDKENDEIGRLSRTFNMMLEKIREDMKKEEQMQYTLLVSAIDPHYIYNTLNTITALAEFGRNEDVVIVSVALIASLKDRLKMKNYKIFDTVRVEKEAMEQYMVIESYLCSQKISYSFLAAEEDLDLMIPKNIIQPLVENSIKHGILCNEDENGQLKSGEIRVTVKRCGSDGEDSGSGAEVRSACAIMIMVEDNGAGMSKEQIEQFFVSLPSDQEMQEKDLAHIGIRNVRMRLQYLYHGEARFSVESREGEGTRICILLPQSADGLEGENTAIF